MFSIEEMCCQGHRLPSDHIHDFFVSLEDGDKNAVNVLFESNPIFFSDSINRQSVIALNKKFFDFSLNLGNYRSNKLIKKYGVSDVMEIYEIVCLYDNGPLILSFTFFNYIDGFIIYHVEFTNQLRDFLNLNSSDYRL